VINQAGEECDGTNDTACPGRCLPPGDPNECECPEIICGDNIVNQPSEVCDGTDDAACPGQCLLDCTCPVVICGDDVVNQPGEMCDGADDAACPGECLPDCTCLGVIPTVSAWGTVIMTLLLLAAGKIYFGRRRAVT
jgi:hypothetical protein